MPRKTISLEAVATIGIDIGKNTFHLIGLDKMGAIVLRQKLSRNQVDTRRAAPILGAASIGPIATNKQSTSAATRRPPAAPQSAAQAARAGRAVCRSISHAHRCPRARAPQSERCHKPPSTQLLNRGAVAHHPLARAAPPAPASVPRPSRVRDHSDNG